MTGGRKVLFGRIRQTGLGIPGKSKSEGLFGKQERAGMKVRQEAQSSHASIFPIVNPARPRLP